MLQQFLYYLVEPSGSGVVQCGIPKVSQGINFGAAFDEDLDIVNSSSDCGCV